METNLGVLESTLFEDGLLHRHNIAQTLQMAPSHELYHPDIHFDPLASTISLILLIFAAAVASDRILGLSRFWIKAMRRWQESGAYAERIKILEVRRRLEGQFENDRDSFDVDKEGD